MIEMPIVSRYLHQRGGLPLGCSERGAKTEPCKRFRQEGGKRPNQEGSSTSSHSSSLEAPQVLASKASEYRGKKSKLHPRNMGKTLCITGFEDAPVSPKQSESLQCFIEAIAEAVAHLVREEHRKVLVFCNQGQNRSAAVCCLILKRLNRCTFDEAVNQLKETAREANSNGRVIAPTKFLCTGGGQYFGMLFNKEGITRRNRRRAESSDDDNDDHSLPLFAPYTLELLCNAGGGSLSIGNLRGWSDSSNALGGGKFDCSINLCGKKKEHADHREEWKNCMSSKKIIACVLQDK
jgi:hypothetical protein